MHASPNAVWLTTIIVVAVTISHVPGLPTQQQFVGKIEKLLTKDDFYGNVLSERIRLNSAQIPIPFRSVVNEHDNVDPKRALLLLPNTTVNHSGIAVELSALIIGTALTCVMYKRYAFQLALIRHMVSTEMDEKKLLAKNKMLAHVLLPGIDMLMITQSRHQTLLDLYEKIVAVASPRNGEQFSKDDYATRVNDGLNVLNEVIQSSCVTSDVRQYHKSFNLTSVSSDEHPDFINDDYAISDKLEPSKIMELTMENENAILNEHQRLFMFWNIDLITLTTLLGVPELPTDP